MPPFSTQQDDLRAFQGVLRSRTVPGLKTPEHFNQQFMKHYTHDISHFVLLY